MKSSIKKQTLKKYFTLEEVERILPKIKDTVIELQVLQEAIELLDSIEIEIDEEEYAPSPMLTKLNQEFHKLSYEFYKKMEKAENYGCVIKDVEQGLVDFLHWFNGREVFLCWKLGENKVQHWHELEEGFTGRQKIIRLG